MTKECLKVELIEVLINNTMFLNKLPELISSKVSIFIYLFLFCYLVIFAFLCLIITPLKDFTPSDTMQLILGNYTNVLSALGASIAAGSGVAVHTKINNLHKRHNELQESLNKIHEKLDSMKSHYVLKNPDKID